MCKTIEIKYRCDRCGHTTTKTQRTKGPLQWTGLWPRTYKRLHQKHVCAACYNEFFQTTLPEYFANRQKSKGERKNATQ